MYHFFINSRCTLLYNYLVRVSVSGVPGHTNDAITIMTLETLDATPKTGFRRAAGVKTTVKLEGVYALI